MKKKWTVLVGILAASTCLCAQIPPGTVLPIMLRTSINTKSSKPGQQIAAELMQTVPLPDRLRIPSGAKIVGQVLEVTAAARGHGARVLFRLDRLVLRSYTISIATDLRALASLMEVNDAYIPLSGATQGLAPRNWRTRLVGGMVGYSAYGGDLSGLAADPSAGCERSDSPQALWVFSSTACGTYGFPRTEIARTGALTGDIVLVSESGNINVRSGSGLLLRVIRVPSADDHEDSR